MINIYLKSSVKEESFRVLSFSEEPRRRAKVVFPRLFPIPIYHQIIRQPFLRQLINAPHPAGPKLLGEVLVCHHLAKPSGMKVLCILLITPTKQVSIYIG